MKYCFLGITFIALIICTSVSGQPIPIPTKRTIQGTVEVENDCPVALFDASFEALEDQPLLYRSVIHQPQVKITNNSGRDIERVGLAFILEADNGGMMIGTALADKIKAGEMRSAMGMAAISDSNKPKVDTTTLKVRITGISFSDGSRWVPPRSNDVLFVMRTLHQREAPLILMNCKDIETNPHMKLRINAENIVAYRLGIVKDTANEFTVKLAEWRTPDAANLVKGKEIEINTAANQTGINTGDIFKLEYFTRYSRTGHSMKLPHGVAFFVAAVKFADGQVWQQDLRREFLVWNE